MQPLVTQLPEVSTGKSRSPTSNILLKSVDTRNYATLPQVIGLKRQVLLYVIQPHECWGQNVD